MSKLDNMHSSIELETAYRVIDWTQGSSYHSYSPWLHAHWEAHKMDQSPQQQKTQKQITATKISSMKLYNKLKNKLVKYFNYSML